MDSSRSSPRPPAKPANLLASIPTPNGNTVRLLHYMGRFSLEILLPEYPEHTLMTTLTHEPFMVREATASEARAWYMMALECGGALHASWPPPATP